MKNIINFLFEVGMLKKTPRTGYQFLGSGSESVADHSFRTAIIGYVLSLQETGADPHKTMLICLFHDLHEARTGDHNYVNKRYVDIDEYKAINDLAEEIPFGGEIKALTREFNEGESLEAKISRDADQLDLILELKEQKDLGNKYAEDWLYYAVKRLVTKGAEEMARAILKTDSTDWWFDKKTDLWVNGPENCKKIK
ncbi:MAG: HD domain-containing protein [Deltaproteobacteria bacterium]|nr:HD domain-containing protein [Deltaproteobacteria bacterium]